MFLPCLNKVSLYVFAILSGSLETVERLNRSCRSGKTPVSIYSSGSHWLPTAGSDGDQRSVTLRNWRVFSFLRLYTRSAYREFLIAIGCFATSEW